MHHRHHSHLAMVLALAALAPVGATTLDAVVVTATRSPDELANLAGAITRLDDQQIELVGATHHADLLNRIPGTLFQRNSGQESLTAIRSPVLTGPGSCGAFLFLEDSIPIRPVGFCNVNELFEVNMSTAQAVEVLRGPAGAMYGSSAMHGAVNVISMDPSKQPTVAVGLEGAPDDFRRGDGVLSFGGPDDAVALATQITHDGGWREDSKVDEQKVNAAWHVALADSTLDVRAAYARLDQDTAGYIQGFEAYRDPEVARSNPNPEAYRDAHAARVNADWSLPLGTVQLELRPYARSSRMEFLQHFLPGKPLERNGQDSVGLIGTVSQPVGTHCTWLAGIDLEYADTSLLQRQDSPTTGLSPAANASRPVGNQYDYTVKSSVVALYARDELVFGDWRIALGMRGEHIRYRYDNRMLDGNTRDDGTVCPLNPNGCLYYRPSDRNDSYTTVTPQFGVTWRYSTNHALYATVVRGYRAPESTELYRLQRQQSTDAPSAERVDSVELGARGTLRKIDYDLAAFGMYKEHLILRDANGFNLSDGRTKHLGVEYQLTYAPIDSLQFALAGTYAKHTYDFTANVAGGENIVAGRTVDTAPRNLWNARATWRPLATITGELEWQHVGSYWVDAANQNGYGGHNVLNLRTAWNIWNGHSATARIVNLMDRQYADRADFAQNNYRYFPGRGRTLFVELRYALE